MILGVVEADERATYYQFSKVDVLGVTKCNKKREKSRKPKKSNAKTGYCRGLDLTCESPCSIDGGFVEVVAALAQEGYCRRCVPMCSDVFRCDNEDAGEFTG